MSTWGRPGRRQYTCVADWLTHTRLRFASASGLKTADRLQLNMILFNLLNLLLEVVIEHLIVLGEITCPYVKATDVVHTFVQM